MNKKVNKSEYPEFFKIDGNKVYDKKEIANKFNCYFTNICMMLLVKITKTTKLINQIVMIYHSK